MRRPHGTSYCIAGTLSLILLLFSISATADPPQVKQNTDDIAALQEQMQLLLDQHFPPLRVIEDSLGAIVTPTPGDITLWSLGGFDFRVNLNSPTPDPSMPREDVPVTLELPRSFNGLANCTPSGPNTVHVVDVIEISPGAASGWSHSGVAHIGLISGGATIVANLFIDDFIVDLPSLTFVQSLAENVGDTGIASSQLHRRDDLTLECNPLGNVFLQGGQNIARFDLYTAPIISIGGLLQPPFMSVVP